MNAILKTAILNRSCPYRQNDVGFKHNNVLCVLCCLLAGISGKSQVLFALVFTTRYLDLLTSFISLYNTTMKVKHSHFAPPYNIL